MNLATPLGSKQRKVLQHLADVWDTYQQIPGPCALADECAIDITSAIRICESLVRRGVMLNASGWMRFPVQVQVGELSAQKYIKPWVTYARLADDPSSALRRSLRRAKARLEKTRKLIAQLELELQEATV